MTNRDKTGGKRNEVLEKDEASKQRENMKDNGIKKNAYINK